MVVMWSRHCLMITLRVWLTSETWKWYFYFIFFSVLCYYCRWNCMFQFWDSSWLRHRSKYSNFLFIFFFFSFFRLLYIDSMNTRWFSQNIHIAWNLILLDGLRRLLFSVLKEPNAFWIFKWLHPDWQCSLATKYFLLFFIKSIKSYSVCQKNMQFHFVFLKYNNKMRWGNNDSVVYWCTGTKWYPKRPPK